MFQCGTVPYLPTATVPGIKMAAPDYDDMDQGDEADIVLEVSADNEAMEDGELSEHEEAAKVWPLLCSLLEPEQF